MSMHQDFSAFLSLNVSKLFKVSGGFSFFPFFFLIEKCKMDPLMYKCYCLSNCVQQGKSKESYRCSQVGWNIFKRLNMTNAEEHKLRRILVFIDMKWWCYSIDAIKCQRAADGQDRGPSSAPSFCCVCFLSVSLLHLFFFPQCSLSFSFTASSDMIIHNLPESDNCVKKGKSWQECEAWAYLRSY